MTNRRVVQGHGEGLFGPEEKTTIDQYITMVVRAADIAHPDGLDWDIDWPNKYLEYATQEGLLSFDDITNHENDIRRDQAFDILWKVLISDDCRTPHQLVEYPLNESKLDESLNFIDRDEIITSTSEKNSKTPIKNRSFC